MYKLLTIWLIDYIIIFMSSKQTKILFIITKSNWGGAQRYVHDIATNINQYLSALQPDAGVTQNAEVIVALGGQGELKHQLENAGIRTITISSLQRNINIFQDAHALFSIIKILKQEQPDVIHLNSSKIGGLGAVAVKIKNIISPRLELKTRRPRVIFTIHGLPHLEPRSFIYRQIIKLSTWISIALSHKTIMVCEHDQLQINNWLFIQNKLTKIHNGIAPFLTQSKTDSHKLLKDISASSVRNFPKINSTFVIGAISELHKNKGLLYLIEALAMLQNKGFNFFCIIIGEGEERSGIELLIKHYSLEDKVLMTGYIKNASQYLKAFDVLVLPSLKEGSPYVLLEAGLAEVPVVASFVGGVQEIIKHKKTGMICRPADAKNIADALITLMTNREKRSIFSSALTEHIKEQYSLHRMLKQTLQVYEQKKL
jgi:glycosyltransferase involved in cell wall biosynthesis